MKIRIIGLWMLYGLIACATKNDTPVSKTDDTKSVFLQDVAYGDDAQQKMDVYLPPNRTRTGTPVLVLIHGGAWLEGDKRDLNDLIQGLQRIFPSYAIVNINYQLNTSRNKPFPTQENDIRKALAYLKQQADVYVVSTRVVTLGFSAGANLALLYAYRKSQADVDVRVAISFVGPTDMQRLHTDTPSQPVRDLLPIMIGDSPSGNPTLYQYYSPVSLVTATTCPTLLFYGGKDDLVPASQGELLHLRLNEQQIPNQLMVYPDDGHAFSEANYLDAFTRIHAFLEVYLR